MANTLSNSGIVDGQVIYANQVNQIIDAFTGAEAYDINISGSLTTSGSFTWNGALDAGGGAVEFVVRGAEGVLYTTASSFVSSTASLVQTLTSNQNVGGITSGDSFSAGSSIEALLRSMLIAYIEPVISNLSINLNGSAISTATRDVGNPFTCNDSSFTATVDSPNGNYPVSASITSSGADGTGSFDLYLSNTLVGSNNFSLGSTLSIVRASSAGNVSFAVNTKSQTTADTQTVNTTFSFNWRNYLAASSTPITDNASAQTVVNSDTVDSLLTTTKTWTATCTSANNNVSNYTYIIYPASYGDLSEVLQGAVDVLSAFNKIGDFTLANTYGSSNSFRIYQSKQPGAFAAGVTLTIS